MSEQVRTRRICIICVFVGLVLYLFSGTKETEFDGLLRRGDPGSASDEYYLDIYLGNEVYEKVPVSVKPRIYTIEECEELYRLTKDQILQRMLAGNESLRMITTDLCFFTENDNCPFSFSWQVDKPGLFDDEGRIITEECFDAVITCKLSYMSFSKDCSIPIHVEPAEEITLRNNKDKLMILIENTLNQNAMTANGEIDVQLPTDVDGKKVKYYFSGTRKNPLFIFGGIFLGLIFGMAFRRDERIKKEKLRQLMLKEYPNILQRMSLYLVTGMPVRKIWSKICDASEKKRGNPIYELMRHSRNELNNGLSEEEVLMDFAQKTETPEYVRFVALISQNQKRGSTKLSDVLREETMKAFIQRKQQAIKEGEQVGTKLLVPMMVILVDVMVMIIVPAFWNI